MAQPVSESALRVPASWRGESIFSVDVEDWFHILDLPGAPGIASWDSLPSRVEKNFLTLLDIFEKRSVRVTCFFLGWVGERYHGLVREAQRRGHEIASHGYAHRLVFELNRREFQEDAVRSRAVLEDITGRRVRGYRSAGFSVTAKTGWFFDALLEAGYEYDSSVFPAVRQHGGMSGARRDPHHLLCRSGILTEFPITVVDTCKRPLCLFGGGYLRLFPGWLIAHMSRRVLAERRPVVFYVHPREIDPHHPRLPMPLLRRFKSYINLRGTAGKIDRITAEFPLITFADFLGSYGGSLPVCPTFERENSSTATPANSIRSTAIDTR